MDFVVVGILLGAIIVGAGEYIRTFGPRRNSRIKRVVTAETDTDRVRLGWLRYCQAIGLLAMTLGLFVLLVTVISVVSHANDGMGTIAVGLSTLASVVVVVVSALLITGHYQRGGFDPTLRYVSETAPLISNRLVLPDPVVTVSPTVAMEAHIFDVDLTAEEERVTVGSEVPSAVAAPAANQVETEESTPLESDLGSSLDFPVAEVVSPEPQPDESSESVRDTSNESRFDYPELAVEPQSEPDYSFDPAPVPVEVPHRDWRTYQPSLSDPKPSDPGEIAGSNGHAASLSSTVPDNPDDGFEDEIEADDSDALPAWNAPPPAKPVIEKHSRSVPSRSQFATEFESTIFADLVDPDAVPAQGEGRFASKLLNELTASDDDPAEPAADVLLDEFSLQTTDRVTQSESDHNR